MTPLERRIALHDYIRRKYIGFVVGTALSILVAAAVISFRSLVVMPQLVVAALSLLLVLASFLLPVVTADIRSNFDARLRCPNCDGSLIYPLSALRRFARHEHCYHCGTTINVTPEIKRRTWGDLVMFLLGMTMICLLLYTYL